MIYQIDHTTTYEYSDPVSLCHNLVHLHPRSCPQQSLLRAYLTVDPLPALTQDFHDFFGNPVSAFTIEHPHRQMRIAAHYQVEVKPARMMELEESPSWERVQEAVRADSSPTGIDAIQFAFDSTYIKCHEELAEFARPSFPEGKPFLLAVLDLTKRIYRGFRYDPQATTLATPLHDVLLHRRGVCQDFAHLQIGCLRSLGLPARYVSGYVLTKPPPGKPRLVGADASHAWIAVYCPDVGWVDFDPTNNLIPQETHITLAWGRDYDDVSPIKGVILGGGSHTMAVSVHVEPTESGTPRHRERE